MEKNKKPEIEMPPLPPETTTEAQQPQPQQKLEMHPEIAATYPQQTEEPEVEAAPEPEPVKEEPKQEETAQAKNFRQIREQKEKAERERDEVLKAYKELTDKQSKPSQDSKHEEQEPEYNINPDDLVEGKHLSSYNKKLKKQQEELRAIQQQMILQATENKLKNEFPDFDKVVSVDNVEKLRSAYPELCATIHSSQADAYSKGVSVYKLIKELGVVKEDLYVEDRDRAIKNASKPRPLASVGAQQGDSPLTKANVFAQGLTDDLKKQLWKETLEAMKNK
jgi:hypothetical protein